MKIAFILSYCDNIGPFVVAKNIVNSLSQDVERIDVYYLKESQNKLNFNSGCTKIRFTENIPFSKYDIFHSHGFRADAYLYYHRNKIKGKRVTTLHQRIKPDYGMYYNRAVGFLLEKIWCFFVADFTRVVTLSRSMQEYYKNILKNTSLEYIYNGISAPDPGGGTGLQKDERDTIDSLKAQYKILGIAARLTALKGVEQIINVMPREKKYALLIIGDGPERNNLEMLAIRLDVSNRCMFLGHKSNLFDYFHYFDIYVITSRSEGFGLVVIEAAAQKIPVVCSDLPIYRELFTDEVVRFQLDDADSLVSAIHYADENKIILREKLYSKYSTTFTDRIMAQNYLKLYRQIVG
jgi:glycosyltransferase involved in cell wall biosynthesis